MGFGKLDLSCSAVVHSDIVPLQTQLQRSIFSFFYYVRFLRIIDDFGYFELGHEAFV